MNTEIGMNIPIHFFCSWSGGKDSCLALNRMLNAGNICNGIFTMIDETGEQSRSHGLHPELLKKQSMMLNLPLYTANANWENYEDEFRKKLSLLKLGGLSNGVFGDIDLEPHREWVERICNECGFRPHLPLWKEDRCALVNEFIEAGFKAVIVVVNTKKMPQRFLGRNIDHKLIVELKETGIDVCGENGEYHSFVYDGPLFKNPVQYSVNKTHSVGEYRFLELE